MKRWQVLSLVAIGIALALTLVWRAGVDQVAAGLDNLGWAGLLRVSAVQLAGTMLCAEALRQLTPGAGFAGAMVSRMVRDGVSNVVGLVPGLGEAAGARVLVSLGVPAGPAAASTAADVATEAIAQALYAALGLALLVPYLDQATVARWAGGSVLAIVPLVAIYLLLRRKLTFVRIETAIVSAANALGFAQIPGLASFGAEAARLSRSHDRLGVSIALHLLAWALGAVQVWLAAAAMGVPLSFAGALALESLVYAARGALFLVPWSIGVQEGSFVLVGALLGLDEATCLALSIALRARDLLLGVPAIMVWVGHEGWFAYRRGAREEGR